MRERHKSYALINIIYRRPSEKAGAGRILYNMKDFESVKRSLRELISIESVKAEPLPGMPYGEGCYRALDYYLNLGKSMGFETKMLDGYAGHIEWGGGDRLFGVLVHTDVVPPGRDWTVPPFSGVEKDGRMYGRGTSDDKGPAIAALYALKRLKDEGFVPDRRVRIIAGSDEESGWSCIEHYFAREEMPGEGFSPDGDFPVINCEKGVLHLNLKYPYFDNYGMNTQGKSFLGFTPQSDSFRLVSLTSGERVNMVPDRAEAVYFGNPVEGAKAQPDGSYKLTCTGVSAHGSKPYEGDSALKKLFAALCFVTDNPVLHFIAETLLAGDHGAGLGLDISDDVSGALTLNAGTCAFDGEHVTLGVDIRFPVTYTQEFVLGKLAENSRAEVSIKTYHRPLYVPEDTPLVQKLLDAWHVVTGREKKCYAVGGATYSRALDCAVAFGPEFPGTPPTLHKADENVLLSELETMCDIYYEALKRCLKD